MKSLQAPLLVVSLWCGLSCLGAGLPSPDFKKIQAGARLQPAEIHRVEEIRSKYGSFFLATAEIAVSWDNGWAADGVVIIHRLAEDSYQLMAIEDPGGTTGKRERSVERIKLETKLAERIIKLIKFEVGRTARAETNESMMMDARIYLFMVPREPARAGETQGSVDGTITQGLCWLVRSLAALPGFNENERIDVLHSINENITALEAVYHVRR